MLVASIMFVFAVRLSTWLTLLVFCLLAAWRSDRRPLLGAVAWLAGFEAAYQITAMIVHPPAELRWVAPVSLSLVIGMPLILALMTLLGARPDPVLLGVALLVFAVWIATGFHVNEGAGPVNVPGEVLNEAAKTLWAAAYLVPLLWGAVVRDQPDDQAGEDRGDKDDDRQRPDDLRLPTFQGG